MKKSEAREILFKAIYEIEIQGDATEDHLDLFLVNNDVTDISTIDYVKKSINTINEKKEELENIVSANLKKDWKLERIPKINIALLKLAIYEIKYTDTPFKVVINEVVDLAKKYSDDSAPSFINGLLASIVPKEDK